MALKVQYPSMRSRNWWDVRLIFLVLRILGCMPEGCDHKQLRQVLPADMQHMLQQQPETGVSWSAPVQPGI